MWRFMIVKKLKVETFEYPISQEEKKVKTFEELIKLIDSKTTDRTRYKLIINGNIIDALFLIRKYNLNPSKQKANCHNTHNALEDCIIEKEIICNILNGNIEPLISESKLQAIKDKIRTFFWGCFIKEPNFIYQFKAEEVYIEFCEFLNEKNGKVLNDYDKPHITKGKEWIDIHHVDEIDLDDIATRTNAALKANDQKELAALSSYNKRERLVYATKVEHFLLHALLDIIRQCESGGLHFLFGSIVKLEIGKFEENEKMKKLQAEKAKFYKIVTFEEIIKIYTKICSGFRIIDIKEYATKFWKLDEYQYEKQHCKALILKINNTLKEMTAQNY